MNEWQLNAWIRRRAEPLFIYVQFAWERTDVVGDSVGFAEDSELRQFTSTNDSKVYLNYSCHEGKETKT